MGQGKIRILTFLEYYVPGYKAGGPIRTIFNLIEACGSDLDFYLLTRNCDIDGEVYKDIDCGDWVSVGPAHVRYIKTPYSMFWIVVDAFRRVRPDVVYFNSFFSFWYTIVPLFILRLGGLRRIILAPRGEFASAALSMKPSRKRFYIAIFKLLRLHEAVSFQASSEDEAKDIKLGLQSHDLDVIVAPDVPGAVKNAVDLADVSMRTSEVLKLVFLSRISPVKNIDYLIEILHGVGARVDLKIFGPVEDRDYYEKCRDLTCRLPGNIHVDWCGELQPSEVHNAFFGADLFVFPTKGENFGHVIMESLSVGTPVIVSDKTPWKEDGSYALKVTPLDDLDGWVAHVERFAGMNANDRLKTRSSALDYANRYRGADESISLSVDMFKNVSVNEVF